MAMNYDYGRMMALPNIFGACPPGFGLPFLGIPPAPSFAPPFWGMGTFPAAAAPFGVPPVAPPFVPPFAPTFAPPVYVPRADEEIKEFVENAIANDPEIPPDANITVEVKNRTVYLHGTVSNKRIKHAAGDDAWWVPQVIDVHNEIEVVPRRERMAAASLAGSGG